MNIRAATESDEAALRLLWEEFDAEVPEPEGFEPQTWEEEWADLRACMAVRGVLVAEDDEGPAGFVEARVEAAGRFRVETVYVRPRARRSGVARRLLAEVAKSARQQGAGLVTLEVLESNALAARVWERLGFAPVVHVLAQPLDALESRLGGVSAAGPSRATTHVQTDDRAAVERVLGRFVPRLETVDVRDAANGWIRIADPTLDGDRSVQARLSRELSDALGAVVVALAVEAGAVVRFRLYERGSMVDEYLSVPGYFGAVSTGDELALAANPTLVARLTGADRDTVRRVARTAASPEELPPADALYAEIAGMMGLEP